MLRPESFLSFFFFNDTATTEIYTLSLHDALPISLDVSGSRSTFDARCAAVSSRSRAAGAAAERSPGATAPRNTTTAPRAAAPRKGLRARHALHGAPATRAPRLRAARPVRWHRRLRRGPARDAPICATTAAAGARHRATRCAHSPAARAPAP